MAVTLSLFAGAGAQFLDNNGVMLSGGLVYTYAAGTTTPLATYTNNIGDTALANPIVLDASGRVPTGQIWLTYGQGYKFTVKTSTGTLIGTYDNIPSAALPPLVNDAASIAYEQGASVTAGNFIIGQTYLITFIGSTNFQSIGAVSNTVGIYFTATGVGSGTGTAEFSRTVQAKLQEFVSVKDFGAVGDGVTNDTAEIQAALTAAGVNRSALYFPGTDNYYLITDALTVPDGVMVYGDGWTSFIQQITLNKGAFIAGDCNVFRDIRVKVADGDDSTFVNCIFANNVNNLTVENCFLELSDLGGTGVHIRGVKNSQIRGNRIYGGKFTSGTAAAASAADILLYSGSQSERHIIDNNHCLSNNSQGIYAGALGYDGDIIISNNICVTLDPATCTETGSWSLVANGGNRRHGIVVTYSNAIAGVPRTVVTGNICRNTRWTGIYKNDLSQGEIIISNNLCDLNGYDNTTPLSGGIYVEAAGKVIVTANTVSNYQSTLTGTGAYTINQATAENLPALFSNNKTIGSLGYGLAIGTGARLLYVTDNLFTGNANTDIYVANNPGANVGGITILSNRIIRSSGNTMPAVTIDPQTSTRVTIIKNNYITGFDNTNISNSNAGIFVRSASKLVQIEGNTIENFYCAFFSDDFYSSGRMADRVIQNNVIRDCAIGFDVSANNNLNTLPLVGNVFIDTTVQVANTKGFPVGRLVQRLGNNFVWQTTAAPTVGSWLVGDRSVNSTPVVGQPKAWSCTVTGAPGTWVSEGNL